MDELLTEAAMLLLIAETAKPMGNAALARACHVSPQFLSAVLAGRVNLQKKLPRALGYEPEMCYRKIAHAQIDVREA